MFDALSFDLRLEAAGDESSWEPWLYIAGVMQGLGLMSLFRDFEQYLLEIISPTVG